MKKQIAFLLVFVAATVLMAVHTTKVLATPANGFTATTLALGRFGDLDVFNYLVPPDAPGGQNSKVWLSLQKTQGPSDVYVQSNV
jgi:hypothetical protein